MSKQWKVVSRKVLVDISKGVANTKLTNANIRLPTDSINTYRHVQNTLANQKAEFHTQSLLENRFFKVLLRGIPSSFLEQTI